MTDDGLHTPIARGEEAAGAIPAGVLPGITRACIMETAGHAGLETTTRMLDIEDLLGADEVLEHREEAS